MSVAPLHSAPADLSDEIVPLPGLSADETELMDGHLEIAAGSLRAWHESPTWGDPDSAEKLHGAFLSLGHAALMLGISFVSTAAKNQRLKAKEFKLRHREIELRHRELDYLEQQLTAQGG